MRGCKAAIPTSVLDLCASVVFHYQRDASFIMVDCYSTLTLQPNILTTSLKTSFTFSNRRKEVIKLKNISY
jgi:hypothetical protein